MMEIKSMYLTGQNKSFVLGRSLEGVTDGPSDTTISTSNRNVYHVELRSKSAVKAGYSYHGGHQDHI